MPNVAQLSPSIPLPEPLPRAALTVEEVAAVLHISRSRAWQLVMAGEIKSVKLGKSRRIPAGEPGDYLARLAREQNGED